MLIHTACADITASGLAGRPGPLRRRLPLRRLGLGGLGVLGLLGLAGLVGAAGCGGGTVDVSVTRGALSYHLGATDCTVHYTGVQDQAPVSIDLNCPVDLQPSSTLPALLLSVPLTTPIATAVALADPQYGSPNYVPGHFLVVTYRDSGRTITCDPQQAMGSVSYLSVPQPKSTNKQRLAGSFSADAALLNCNSDSGRESGGPLKISGSFDLLAP